MRVLSLSSLLALGVVSVAGCGGGSVGSSSGPSPTLTDYDPPPGAAAPNDYDRPPSDYDHGTPPSGTSVLCETLCHVALSLHCGVADTAGVSQVQCEAKCGAAYAQVTCANELATAYSCVFQGIDLDCDRLNGAFSVDELKRLARDATACNDSVQAYAACTGEDVTPPPGICQPTSDCQNCADECDQCRCNGTDAAACNRICANF
jgi:hypothetical protein